MKRDKSERGHEAYGGARDIGDSPRTGLYGHLVDALQEVVQILHGSLRNEIGHLEASVNAQVDDVRVELGDGTSQSLFIGRILIEDASNTK